MPLVTARKATSSIALGAVFLGLTLACASDSEPDSGQSWVCEDGSGFRLRDEDCPDDDGGGGGGYVHGGHRRYYPSGTSIPAVGSKLPPGGTLTRPSGFVGKYPASGGFGSSKVSSGS